VHSTLPAWLQNGQQKAVSSFSTFFRGAAFARVDFRFPIDLVDRPS
jgi:hypothetical protein